MVIIAVLFSSLILGCVMAADQKRRVCGTNGVFYPSVDEFLKAVCTEDITLQPTGWSYCLNGGKGPDPKRPASKICGLSEKPGSVPVTYAGRVEFNKARCADRSIDLVYYGECGTCTKENICIREPGFDRNKPCGNDGKVYDTLCDFSMAVCESLKNGPRLRRVFRSECGKNTQG